VGILIPTYSYGENSDDKGFDNYLDRFTLLNALGKPMKMWIVFTVTVVIGISGHLFVYFYQSQVKNKKHQYEEAHKLNVSEATIRCHTLFISGVNNELTSEEAIKSLKTLFPDLAKACGVTKNIDPPLVIQMLADFENLVPMQKEIEKNGFKNEYYKQRF